MMYTVRYHGEGRGIDFVKFKLKFDPPQPLPSLAAFALYSHTKYAALMSHSSSGSCNRSTQSLRRADDGSICTRTHPWYSAQLPQFRLA
jgi:hypothetical protein